MAHPRRRATGFTLIELLTVLGIIAILVAILLPVIGKVRQSAHVTDTRNTMNKLASAIERYRQEQGAYPGVLPNSEFSNSKGLSTNIKQGSVGITMTENMMLSLAGALEPNPNLSAQNPSLAANPPSINLSKMGSGPMTQVVNPNRRVRLAAYIDAAPGQLTPPQLGTTWAGSGSPGTGTTSANTNGACDSDVPEPMDAFGQVNPTRSSQAGMPIIFLRANVGAPGVVGDPSGSGSYPGVPYESGAGSYQYDMAWIRPYVEQTYLPQRDPYNTGGPTTPVTKPFSTTEFPTRTVTGAKTSPQGAASYFAHASIPDTAKGQNSYILISAGPDGLFGTQDDIVNVGG